MTAMPVAGFKESFDNGDLRAIYTFGKGEPIPYYRQCFPKGVPNIHDVPVSTEKRKFIDLDIIVRDLDYVITAPPGTPKDRVQFLDDAFMKALYEPELKNIWEKRGDTWSPLSGPKTSEVVIKGKELITRVGAKNLDYILFKKYY